MTAEATLNDEYTYTMPKNLQIGLMVASACWFSIDGIAVLPIGLLFALGTIAQKYETTRIASLRTGWRMLARCGAVSVASFLVVAFQVGIAKHGVDLGIFTPLQRWLS